MSNNKKNVKPAAKPVRHPAVNKAAEPCNPAISPLSPSEAVYGLVGWLTTRPTPLVLSSGHNASAPAELVNAYIQVQNLERPRDGWEKAMVRMPERLDSITNTAGEQLASAACEVETVDERASSMTTILLTYDMADQNVIVARLIQNLQAHRNGMRDKLRSGRDWHQAELDTLVKAVNDMDNILQGNFSVL